MLFDDAVVELVERHFVAVITDHPRGSTEPKRNPAIWERCETWKRYPNSAAIVWLVSADASRRAGLVYNPIKEPAQLLAWMEAVLVLDGLVEEPSPEQVHRAVLQRMRSALGELWRWDGENKPERSFQTERGGFDAVATAVTDAELCGAKEADAMLARLRAPSAERRAELRGLLGQLLDAARTAGLGEVPWFDRFAGWHEADRLGGEAEHEAAVRMFRAWLAREIAAGRVEPGDELRATLDELGVRRPDR